MLMKSLGIAFGTLLLLGLVLLYVRARTQQSSLDKKQQLAVASESEQTPEHAVIVHLMYEPTAAGYPKDTGLVDRMHALQDQLIEAINAANVGELDGDEFGQGECVIYMYGPNADLLWDAIKAIVVSSDFGEGSYVYKRYGDVNDNDAIEVKESL